MTQWFLCDAYQCEVILGIPDHELVQYVVKHCAAIRLRRRSPWRIKLVGVPMLLVFWTQRLGALGTLRKE
jgi:hypothetical protein